MDGDRLQRIIEKRKDKSGRIISILEEIQEEYGYLPKDALAYTSKELDLPLSQLFSIATFYTAFSLKPRGRHIISVCRGTACHVKGGDKILEAVERHLGIKEGETTSDLEYTLETAACFGCCALAPTMMINKEVYGRLTPKKVVEIFGHEGEREEDATET